MPLVQGIMKSTHSRRIVPTTDTRLSVAEGLRLFDLGLPANYLPPFLEVFIEDVPGGTVVPFILVAAVVARARSAHSRTQNRREATNGGAAEAGDPQEALTKSR